MSLETILEPPTEGTVLRVKQDLSTTAEGLKVIEYVENHVENTTFITYMDSVTDQCNIYADDMVHFLDSAHEENVRILKTCDLADCLK